MSAIITNVRALEILDSRGNPTVRVKLELECGIRVDASVPSGASTGENEAVELRDGDKGRYGGKGVLQAVQNVNDVIAPAVIGMDCREQIAIDRAMIELDGTPNKAKLGANAILGVSMAVAKAAAEYCDLPLYSYLGGPAARTLPVPMMNILNGGKHAENSVDFQEFMVFPLGAPSFREALRMGAETFHALKGILKKKGYAVGVGDEGGFAPDLKSNEEACDVIVEAIKAAGYEPGKDIFLALDPAASSFFEDGSYNLAKSGQGRKSTDEMIELFSRWCSAYPIASIEERLGRFCQDDRQDGGPGSDRGGRPLRHQPGLRPPGDQGQGGQRGADKAQPDRHRHRDHRDHRALPQGRMGLCDIPQVRGDRGHLHGGLCGGHGGRPDQDRFRLQERADRQVQPAA
jgi:enolase